MSSTAAAPQSLDRLLSDFLAYLEFERGLCAQHARGLPQRPRATGRVPGRARARPARRHPPRPRRLSFRARGRRLIRRDAPAQGGVPAFLLPPPAPRGPDRARPHSRSCAAPRRAQRLPACADPRRGRPVPGRTNRFHARTRCATGRCSSRSTPAAYEHRRRSGSTLDDRRPPGGAPLRAREGRARSASSRSAAKRSPPCGAYLARGVRCSSA